MREQPRDPFIHGHWSAALTLDLWQCLVWAPIAHLVAAIDTSHQVERTLRNLNAVDSHEFVQIMHVTHDESRLAIELQDSGQPTRHHSRGVNDHDRILNLARSFCE